MDAPRNASTELRDRAGELSDWIDWQTLTKRFEHLGLAQFWAELANWPGHGDQLVDDL